jgi:hypothetical protein
VEPADRQATVWVEITEATLQAIPDIQDLDQDGYHDINPEPDQHTPACYLGTAQPSRTSFLRTWDVGS